MSTDIPIAPESAPEAAPRHLQAKSSEHTYSDDDGIKDPLHVLSSRINELDTQLSKLANGCRGLGRVAGLLLEIKNTREQLSRTRKDFDTTRVRFAREDYMSKARASNSEQLYSPTQCSSKHSPPFDVLPTVLEVLKNLGDSFLVLRDRIIDFRESTDEGHHLKSVLLALGRHLKKLAPDPRTASGKSNAPSTHQYILRFAIELGPMFEKVTAAVCEFAEVGVSAISHEQERASSSLTNLLTVSTFFSGVTASTLGMSIGRTDHINTVLVSNLLWFISLIFSVGATLNCLLALAWKATRSGSRGGNPPIWVTLWIDGSPLIFLGISIVTFSAGLVVFAFASVQAFYTPYLAIASTAVTFIGLVAISSWMSYEIFATRRFSHKSVDSDSKLYSVLGGLGVGITNALPSVKHRDGDLQDDVEKLGEPEESPTREYNSLRMEHKNDVQDIV